MTHDPSGPLRGQCRHAIARPWIGQSHLRSVPDCGPMSPPERRARIPPAACVIASSVHPRRKVGIGGGASVAVAADFLVVNRERPYRTKQKPAKHGPFSRAGVHDWGNSSHLDAREATGRRW
jgi:hypothetical protein